jgi:hypothetical protein
VAWSRVNLTFTFRNTSLDITIFWDVTQCWLVNLYSRFVQSSCPYLWQFTKIKCWFFLEYLEDGTVHIKLQSTWDILQNSFEDISILEHDATSFRNIGFDVSKLLSVFNVSVSMGPWRICICAIPTFFISVLYLAHCRSVVSLNYASFFSFFLVSYLSAHSCLLYFFLSDVFSLGPTFLLTVSDR